MKKNALVGTAIVFVALGGAGSRAPLAQTPTPAAPAGLGAPAAVIAQYCVGCHKGRSDVVQLLVDRGARLDLEDKGTRDTRSLNGAQGWLPIHWAEGLIRVGVQSAIAHPDTAALIRKLMTERGLRIPPGPKTSACITQVCQ